MVFSKDQNPICNIMVSSVGPGRATGPDVIRETTGMDLAMKLHYISGVYFFSSEASRGLNILSIKESMFKWLSDYYLICGRFWLSDNGRPYMKCNDCGARIIEAECDRTIQEWLEMKDRSVDELLAYHVPLGPELSYSPCCYIQITKFRCGGSSLGLSWAHILGDPYSASDAINSWGQFHGRLKSYGPLKIIPPLSRVHESKFTLAKEPLSVKRVNPVGDIWITPNSYKMETFTFQLTAQQVIQLHSKVCRNSKSVEIPIFETLCATMWQCIARARDGSELKLVTVCKKNPKAPRSEVLSNSQIIRSVEADFCVADSGLEKLALLMLEQAVDETAQVEELVERDNGVDDYIVYGANLTFVDLEEAGLYGLELNGHKPEFAYCTVRGVGDEGAVLVLPRPNGGRVVSVTLPENEVGKLKTELEKNGALFENGME